MLLGAAEAGLAGADGEVEAEQLRSCLQDASARRSRLLAGLKQHRRQSRAMRAAVRSLRQLKLDG